MAVAAGSAMSVAIVRPTLLYSTSDVLINNMAWTLRRLPVFGIPGDGEYRVQPVHVDDVADLCVRQAAIHELMESLLVGRDRATCPNRVQRMAGRQRDDCRPPLLIGVGAQLPSG